MKIERTSLHKAVSATLLMLLAACSSPAAPSVPPAPTPLADVATPEPAVPSPTVTASPSIEVPTPAPRKPRPSLDMDLDEIAAYLTSSITLLDLAEADLAVVITYHDPGSETPFPLGSYRLDSMEQVTNDAPPGRYTLEFHQPAAASTATTCTIEVGSDEGYVFAALGDAIALTSTGSTPSVADDLFVATSSLCIEE